MLSFITFRNLPEQLEIVADDQGLDDMIFYLQSVKKSKDHMHLTIDTEINAYPLPKNRKKVQFARSVKIEFAGKNQWASPPNLAQE